LLKNDLTHGKNKVFEEEIIDHFCNSHIILPAVKQDQFSEHLKLSDCKITDLDSPHALVSEDSDSDVGFLYHVAVIDPISNRQSYFVSASPHKTHHLRFLFGSATAADYRMATQKER
jgi:hypothetical protein